MNSIGGLSNKGVLRDGPIIRYSEVVQVVYYSEGCPNVQNIQRVV